VYYFVLYYMNTLYYICLYFYNYNNQGLLSTQNLKSHGTLEVSGLATFEDTITIGSQLALNPGGITLDIAKHSGFDFYI